MPIEERLRRLIMSRFPTVKDFAAEAEIPYTTLLSVFKRGIDNTGITNIQKLCKTLGITMEGLCEGRIEYTRPEQSKETTFRAHQNALFLALLDGGVDLDGMKITQEEALLVDDCLTATVEILRRRREREARS